MIYNHPAKNPKWLGDRSSLPEEFYRRLESLMEAAQSLVLEGAAQSDAVTHGSSLGNLEQLRHGVSHAILVRKIIALRRARESIFSADLFADPSWDILLDLYGAHIAQHRVPVSSLCIAAAVPPTTALRWIRNLEDADLIERQPDPHDGRRIFVQLTHRAVRKMQTLFDQIAKNLATGR